MRPPRLFLAALPFVLAACAAPDEVALGDEASAAVSRVATAACTGSDGDWLWSKLGPVPGLGEPAAAGDGVFAPTLVSSGGLLHLWYTQKVGQSYTLLHATSRDEGQSFDAPAAITGLPAGVVGTYPSVWRSGAGFSMIFGSGSFRAASSADGVAFTVSAAPVLEASFAQGRFDALSVIYPDRVAGDSGDVLFFSGFDGAHVRIGRAVEAAAGSFVVDPPEPVIDLGAAADFDNAAAAEPHVELAFGRWWMWYGGYDTSHTNPGPYRVGSASSVDGVAWTKHGVAVELGASGTDAWSTRDPAVVATAGRWLMFYVGLGDDDRYRLHRAASAACSPHAR